MDAYIEANSSKKKFLVPLVVLLLCGVAMTGAAYAYNSTVDGTGSISDVDYVTIDFDGAKYDSEKMVYASTGALTFNTATKLVGEKKTTTYTVDESVTIMTVNVKIDKAQGDETYQVPTLSFVDVSKVPSGVTLKIGNAVANTDGTYSFAITASGTYSGEGAPSTEGFTFTMQAKVIAA